MRKMLMSFFDSIGRAARIANAVDNRRAPSASDLEGLGVDMTEYRKIRRV